MLFLTFCWPKNYVHFYVGAGDDVGICVCLCDVHFSAIINYFQKFAARI